MASINDLRRDLFEYAHYDDVLGRVQAGYTVTDYNGVAYTELDVVSCLEVYEACFQASGYVVVRNSVDKVWELKEIY